MVYQSQSSTNCQSTVLHIFPHADADADIQTDTDRQTQKKRQTDTDIETDTGTDTDTDADTDIDIDTDAKTQIDTSDICRNMTHVKKTCKKISLRKHRAL